MLTRDNEKFYQNTTLYYVGRDEDGGLFLKQFDGCKASTDGTVISCITPEGKQHMLSFQLDEMYANRQQATCFWISLLVHDFQDMVDQVRDLVDEFSEDEDDGECQGSTCDDCVAALEANSLVEDDEDEGPICQSIASEQWREYDFCDRVYRIYDPLWLYVGETTHRIVDSEGVVHCVPKPGEWDCVLRWKVRPGEAPVSF